MSWGSDMSLSLAVRKRPQTGTDSRTIDLRWPGRHILLALLGRCSVMTATRSPRRPVFSLLTTLAVSALVLACDKGARGPLANGDDVAGAGAAGFSAASGGGAGSGGVGPGSLAQKYADYFPIGAAVSNFQISFLDQVLAQDFNHLTCENAMKAADIHPAEASFAWQDADRIADFARLHGMKLTGHALLWHARTPDWMFAGVTAGDAASVELLKGRLKAHIEAVIARYADVVDNWDVVNEAISDDPAKTYRDGSEGSKWYELFGSEEYIYWAYQFARDALEAKAPGSSAGKLYYNEYVATVKADKILKMLAWLKDVKG